MKAVEGFGFRKIERLVGCGIKGVIHPILVPTEPHCRKVIGIAIARKVGTRLENVAISDRVQHFGDRHADVDGVMCLVSPPKREKLRRHCQRPKCQDSQHEAEKPRKPWIDAGVAVIGIASGFVGAFLLARIEWAILSGVICLICVTFLIGEIPWTRHKLHRRYLIAVRPLHGAL